LGTSSPTHAALLNVSVQGDRVSLQAREVSLGSVVRAIVEEAGIDLKSSDPLTKPISMELAGLSVEETLRRLLAQQNFTLIFRKTSEAKFVITEVRILPQGGRENTVPAARPERPVRVETPVNIPPPPSPPEAAPPGPMVDPVKRYERDGFRQEFENIHRIAEDIAIDAPETPPMPEDAPVPEGMPSPMAPRLTSNPGGMRIKEVAPSSVFSQIGLKGGDVVRDVNGKAVTSKEEFIEVLQEALEDQPMIRIDRADENNMTNPIYIQLNSPEYPDPSNPPPAPAP